MKYGWHLCFWMKIIYLFLLNLSAYFSPRLKSNWEKGYWYGQQIFWHKYIFKNYLLKRYLFRQRNTWNLMTTVKRYFCGMNLWKKWSKYSVKKIKYYSAKDKLWDGLGQFMAMGFVQRNLSNWGCGFFYFTYMLLYCVMI